VTERETEQLLDTYDRLSHTTANMLSAARDGDWQRLADLEKDCSSLVACLSNLEKDDPLPEPLRARKVAMIRSVLADDAAIRDITEPWLARLGTMLGTNRREQLLLKSYGPPRAADA
jgi:flagellar protein FliT